MIRRGSRSGWAVWLSAVSLGLSFLGLTGLFGRWERLARNRLAGRSDRAISNPNQREAEFGKDGIHPDGTVRARAVFEPNGTGTISAGPPRPGDARRVSIRQAAETWRRSMGPRRVVIDQVCLVHDVSSFLEAISAWDERHFFPI